MAIKSLDKSSLVTPQTTNSMLAGYSFQDFELIESVFVASNTATITFNNLNQYSTEYKHLQLRILGRTDRSGETGDVLLVRFNGNSSNYAWHYLTGNGSSVGSSNGVSQTEIWLWRLAAPNNTANSFGAMVMDIIDAYSNKNKTVRALSGMTGSANEIFLGSGLWNNTASVISINLDQIGNNFVAGSRFSLYGIR
jgi:hypothetical protein